MTLSVKEDIIYAIKESKMMGLDSKDAIINSASRLANVPASWVSDVYNDIMKGNYK